MADDVRSAETSENIKKHKKSHKIVVQIGVMIIVLFTMVIAAVSNMVTMASFSTALSTEMKLFTSYLSNIVEGIEEYQSMTWLMDYWRDNSSSLTDELTEVLINGKECDIQDILDSLSKEYANEVTDEEAAALSPEDQRRFAVFCYKEFQDLFNFYQDENEESAIILSIAKKNGDDPVVLVTNVLDEGVFLGQIGNIEEIKKIIENTQTAIEANVWKWAFTKPDSMMDFGTSLEVPGYEGTYYVELLGAVTADLVYGEMVFTDHIRNEVIAMMVFNMWAILFFLYLIVPRPLARVKKCVTEYAKTKDAEALTESLSAIHSSNEIGAFADVFSSMALEMERYTREMEKLAGERERVETELNVATNIQMQMLPQNFPERSEFSLFASMEPAKEVGGDFYDCYMIDDDHLALTIADVSGKGVPAALFMAVSKTMLKNRTTVGGTPAEILRDVNNWLCEGNDNCMFVTVWHGILTISTGELICANAGHECPGIRFKDEAFSLVRTEHGSPLGLLEDMEFTDEKYVLSGGDALLIYTDGVPEAHAIDGSMFGEERLEAVLGGISKDDAPQTIMQKVREAVDSFSGEAPQYDDITMMCLVMS